MNDINNAMHSEILLTIKLQAELFVDPKRIRLLKEIRQCGSINQAAKNAQVSYKSAWDHLEAMNSISPKPLLERNIGGKHGGGTQLTPYAERLLQLYDLLEKTQEKAFHCLQDESVPLNSILSATAKFSLQSSARNQFFGTISRMFEEKINRLVEIQLPEVKQPFYAMITEKSAVRLKLVLGKEVMMMIKAPWVKLLEQPQSKYNNFPVTVENIVEKGDTKEVLLRAAPNVEFCATVEKTQPLTIGQSIYAHMDPEQIILLTLD